MSLMTYNPLSLLTPTTVSKIRMLASTNRDASEGFQQAADLTERAVLKTLYQTLSHQREQFAISLDDLLLDTTEDESGAPVASAIHRWWMSLRSALSPHTEAALLKEVLRGEQTLMAFYESLLPELAGDAATAELNHQYASIVRSSKALEHLRETVAT